MNIHQLAEFHNDARGDSRVGKALDILSVLESVLPVVASFVPELSRASKILTAIDPEVRKLLPEIAALADHDEAKG